MRWLRLKKKESILKGSSVVETVQKVLTDRTSLANSIKLSIITKYESLQPFKTKIASINC